MSLIESWVSGWRPSEDWATLACAERAVLMRAVKEKWNRGRMKGIDDVPSYIRALQDAGLDNFMLFVPLSSLGLDSA